jgi:hypothetical protein
MTTHDDGTKPYGLAEHEKMRADAGLAEHYRQQIETLEGELAHARALRVERDDYRDRLMAGDEAYRQQCVKLCAAEAERDEARAEVDTQRAKRIVLRSKMIAVEDERDAMRPVVEAVRKLHEPTLQSVEWFHDQTGKGEALCCPSCRPADPTDWSPPVGEAGVEPEGFVPSYVLSPCPTLAAVDQMATSDPAEPADTDLSADLFELVAAITGTRAAGHTYISTACLHAAEPGRESLHLECQTGGRRWDGTTKKPARCKYEHCQAPCICACHVAAPAEVTG